MTTPEDINKNNFEKKEDPKVTPENLEKKEISQEELLDWLDNEENTFKAETADAISNANSVGLDQPTFEKIKDETGIEQALGGINQEAGRVVVESKKELVDKRHEEISSELQYELDNLNFLKEERVRRITYLKKLKDDFKKEAPYLSASETDYRDKQINEVEFEVSYTIPNKIEKTGKKIETLKNQKYEDVDIENVALKATEEEAEKIRTAIKDKFENYLTQDFSGEKTLGESVKSLEEKLEDFDSKGRLNTSAQQIVEGVKDVLRGKLNLKDVPNFQIDRMPIDFNLKDKIRDLLIKKMLTMNNFDSLKMVVNVFDFTQEQMRGINEKLDRIQRGEYVSPGTGSVEDRGKFENPYGIIARANELMGLKPKRKANSPWTNLNNPPPGWDPNSRF